MFVIARALSGQRGKLVERASLKAQVQPPSLPLRKDGTNTFDASLRALCDVGLARTKGSTVTYSDQAPDASMGAGAIAISGNPTAATAGGSQPFPVLQPYLTMNYCIALQGIFPSRN